MPLADSHIHFFARGFPSRYGVMFPKGGDFAFYQAIRQVHDIDRALIVGYEGEPWAAGNNRHIARLAREHSWMAPLAFCSTTDRPTASRFSRWWKDGFYGISLYLDTDAACSGVLTWSDDILTLLNAHRAIISINVPITHIRSLRPFFKKLPETRILISHLGLPGTISPKATDSSTRRLLSPLMDQADLAHVGVKLSAFYACNAYPHPGLSPVVATIRSAFGDKRLYWASDFSPALDDVSFAQTIEGLRLHLGKGAPAKALFHDNLNRIIDRVSPLKS